MELFKSLVDHPWLLAGVLLLLAFLVYSVIRGLFRIALFIAIALAGLVLWFRIVGKDIPEDVGRLARGAGKMAQGAVEKAGDLLEKGQQELEKKEDSTEK